MKKTSKKLRPGDFVEVKAPAEILQTLDAEGTLDQLPFMPEMVEFCGRKFQVSKRVVKTCYYTKAGSSGMRKVQSRRCRPSRGFTLLRRGTWRLSEGVYDFLARGLAAKSRGQC